jgi:spore maturation protein CgeB
MRILSCCPKGYYSGATGTSYEYLSFVEAPRRMGHQVDSFDYQLEMNAGREAMNETVLSQIKQGGYDLVIVVTHEDEFLPEVLGEAGKHTILMAWNCDDDWRWDNYSSKWAEHYACMVTTYRHIYEANKKNYPNLLLSQWGCTGLSDGVDTPKDIGISFVGLCYGERGRQIRLLRRKLGMVTQGKGVTTWRSRWRARLAWRLLGIRDKGDAYELPDQEAVAELWKRSKLSFTPLEASSGGGLQIKGRVFDMGLSGTVMLCSKNPGLYEFYEPETEFVEYESMAECIDKAKHLLAHEGERAAIARRYYERTKAEHMWSHRFRALFKEMGLPG